MQRLLLPQDRRSFKFTVQDAELPEFNQAVSLAFGECFERENSVSRFREDSLVAALKRSTLVMEKPSEEVPPELPRARGSNEQMRATSGSNTSPDGRKEEANHCQREVSGQAQTCKLQTSEESEPLYGDGLLASTLGLASMNASPKARQRKPSENLDLSTHEGKQSQDHREFSLQLRRENNGRVTQPTSDSGHRMSRGSAGDAKLSTFMSKNTEKPKAKRFAVPKKEPRGSGDEGTELGCAGKFERACRLI